MELSQEVGHLVDRHVYSEASGSHDRRGPITSFILVVEMVSGEAVVLCLMAGALLSSGVARRVTRPMSHEVAGVLPLPAPTEPRTEKW